MKKWLLALLTAACALLLCACDGVFEEDYLSVTPHDEQYTVDEDSDALTAENYLGLKNAILSFVENHTEYGVIRIYHYDGEVESDLADAAYEVAKSDPLGAYAVDYMTHESTLIVSYYEIHIYITFARTQEEIDAVKRVNSLASLREEFKRALRDGEQTCVLRVLSYTEQDFAAIAQSCYLEDPFEFVELPTIEVSLYPSTGVQRIVHISFSYDMTDAERVAARGALSSAFSSLSAGAAAMPSDARRFMELTDRLLIRLEDAEGDEQALLYDALCRDRVNADSLALALRLLCDECGIPCTVVSGRRSNLGYDWNIVSLSGVNYHVDLLRDLTAGRSGVELYSDREMEDEYTWDRAAYPPCADLPEVPAYLPQPIEPEVPEHAPEAPAEAPAEPKTPEEA